MKTLPDQWLSKREWKLITTSEKWLIQVVEGEACLAFGSREPSGLFWGLHVEVGAHIVLGGPVWAMCANEYVMTRISVSESEPVDLEARVVI